MFRINSIKNENRDKIRVYDEHENSYGNYYTILTGDNASGKSSLLSKAINYFLFKDGNDDEFDTAVQLNLLSQSKPSKIIALCNSKFDKFTLNDIFNKWIYKNETSKNSNFYIHPEINKNARKEMADVINQCLKNTLHYKKVRSTYDIYRVQEAFKMFGVRPELHLKYIINKQNANYILARLKLLIYEVPSFYDESLTSEVKKNNYANDIQKTRYLDELIDMFVKGDVNHHITDALVTMLQKLQDGQYSANYFGEVYFFVAEGTLYSESTGLSYIIDNEVEIKIIPFLFFLDVLSVTDIQVMHLDSNKEVNISSLSSGQRTLFGHAIVLSCFVEKNCMICIDEPENSLHPEWQLNFMRFISLLCPDYIEAHILVATHSPQIISGMKFDNGCVLSLANRDNIESIKIRKGIKYEEGGFYELQPLKNYREQSADKQLTAIFKSPGYKNDFILRKLLLILSKISKKISLTKSDADFMVEIHVLIEKMRIPEGDPVHLLLKQIVSFENARCSDD